MWCEWHKQWPLDARLYHMETAVNARYKLIFPHGALPQRNGERVCGVVHRGPIVPGEVAIQPPAPGGWRGCSPPNTSIRLAV